MTHRFNQTVIISAEALSQEVNGETVVLDLKTEQYFGLDKVGTRIWQLINEHRELQTTFDVMKEEFDVEGDRLESDMNMLLTEMMKSGLITLENQA